MSKLFEKFLELKARAEAAKQSSSLIDSMRLIQLQAAREIAPMWKNTNFVGFINSNAHGLEQKLKEAEESMSHAWYICRDGKMGIEEFEEVVGRWKRGHFEAIETFNRRSEC